MMRVLVTGAAGFIGSHLCKELLNRGFYLTGVDSFSDYYSIEYKKKRTEAILGSNLEIKTVDLSNLESVRTLISSSKYDLVVHLAAQPGVRLPVEQNNIYVRDNIVAFVNVASTVAEFKVPNFYFASSSSVYGNDSTVPYNENEKMLNPLSFYGATKLSNEILARALFMGTDINVVGLRFFSVYGEWGRPDMAYFKLIKCLTENKPFTIFGDGKKMRDFTYIKDVIDIVSRMIDKSFAGELPSYQLINVGGGAPYELLYVIKTLENLSGNTIILNRQPDNDKDVNITFADSSLQEKLINIKPSVSLETGLSEVWNWSVKNQVLIKEI
jgi:UDP-glucuronate 4-epimerase